MRLKKHEFDIVIVGAGIAGLALANALDSTNLKVAVIEANAFRHELPTIEDDIESYDARVCAFTQGSIRFLKELGVWQTITAARSQFFDRMHVWDGEGTGAITFDGADIGATELGYIVENRIVVHSLLENLSFSSNIKLLDNTIIDDIQTISDKEGVKQKLVLGDKEILTRLLVGADGAQSFIRQNYGFKTREWDYGHHAIVCTIETEYPHDTTAWQRFMKTGPIALLPLQSREGRFCSIVWSAETAFAEQILAMNDEEFCQALAAHTECRLGQIKTATKRFAIPLRQRHAVDYVQQGVALVADAAHTIHPLAGLGINMGLEDVNVLAQELIRAKKRGAHLSEAYILSRYQRRRKGENLLVMAAMEGFKRLFEQPALPVLWLRNRGMSAVDQMAVVKKQIIKQVMGL